jgi:nitric oxide dioxygenase
MLSSEARPYINASVPVLRQHGVAITRTFYARLFAAHPELANVFNQGNQANGAQQNALAAAVLAYAENVDRADLLAPVLSRIAHKHASIGVLPAHYPIVGRHLLGAIREVLGAAASVELLAAWDEAYWLLAGELIAAEARLYERAQAAPGDFRTLKVAQVRPESDDLISYYLQLPVGGSPGAFRPGQYVSVEVDTAPGRRQIRQYSLSDAPERPHWRITVKREPSVENRPQGHVSNLLHDNVKSGDTLRVSAPFGDFTPKLDADTPISLFTAGVGITPLLSVLNGLGEIRSQRPILFAHATRATPPAALLGEVAAAQAVLPRLSSRLFSEAPSVGMQDHPAFRGGRMQWASADLSDFLHGDFYLCGPLGFMQEQWRALVALGVSPARLHREVFGPELLDHLLA